MKGMCYSCFKSNTNIAFDTRFGKVMCKDCIEKTAKDYGSALTEYWYQFIKTMPSTSKPMFTFFGGKKNNE